MTDEEAARIDELRAKALQGARASKKAKETRKTRNENLYSKQNNGLLQKSGQGPFHDTYGAAQAGDTLTRPIRKAELGERSNIAQKSYMR